MTTGSTASWPMARAARSARRHTARARCRAAPAAAARQDEVAQRRQLAVELIDPAFEPRHMRLANRRLLDSRGDLVRRVGQPRADGEQVALHGDAHLVEVRFESGGPGHADAGLQFVHLAVGGDPEVGLADPRAVEEAGFAGIAGLRIDLHVRELYGFGLTRRRLIPTWPLERSRNLLPSPRRPNGSASAVTCWPGTGRTGATCRGATPATRTTSSSRRSCSSRRRSTACCRSITSGWEVPELRGAGRGAGGRGAGDVVSARLQHPAAPAAVDRAAGGRQPRRSVAVRRRDAAGVQGHR